MTDAAPRWICLSCRSQMEATELGKSTRRGWRGVRRIVALFHLRCPVCGATRTGNVAVGHELAGQADTAEEHDGAAR